MEKPFKDILYEHEREDRAAIGSEEGMMNAVRKEFSNAGQLIFQARQQGFSLSDFFSGSPLPAGMPLPVRRSQTFYIKKHTAVQRPYMHSHEFYELVYVQTGKCLQTLKDGRQTQLKKGQCCLLRPGAAHRIERADRGDVILKAVIPCGLFARSTDDIPLPNHEIIMFERTSGFAEHLLIRLLRESRLRDACHGSATRALLSLLFCELARGQTECSADAERFYDEYFQTQLKRASLAHFAGTYGYTPAYASRLVRRQTGRKFSELLSEYRLQRAAELLSSTDMSVEDIALEIGYKVPSALYKHFGARFGMTPSQYRTGIK